MTEMMSSMQTKGRRQNFLLQLHRGSFNFTLFAQFGQDPPWNHIVFTTNCEKWKVKSTGSKTVHQNRYMSTINKNLLHFSWSITKIDLKTNKQTNKTKQTKIKQSKAKQHKTKQINKNQTLRNGKKIDVGILW